MESVMFRCCAFQLIFALLTTLPIVSSQSPSSTISSTISSTSLRSTLSGLGGSSTPVDITAVAGVDATFYCAGDFVEWTVYKRPPLMVFSSQFNVPIKSPDKYSISGQYNLVVKNVNPTTDGLTYGCRNGPDATTYVNLVVIDESQFTMTVSPPDVLRVGDVVTVTCSVKYGGVTTDDSNTKPLDSLQDPILTIALDDQSIQTGGEYNQPSDGSGIHIKSSTVNHTIQASDAGRILKCTVSSLTYTKTLVQDLNMLYPPIPSRFSNSLNTTGSQTNPVSVLAGRSIRCNANGNPKPTVQWISMTDGMTSPAPSNNKGYADLTVPETPETQKWQCSAFNNQGNSSSSSPYIVYLKVTGSGNATEVEAKDEKTDNKVGLGVGLGIGLGVPVLIAIIVIIVILMRRKNNHTGGTEVIKTSKAPPSTESGKPINEPHRPQRPVSGTRNGPSINPNPNPMYQPPVYPEQMTTAAPVKTTPDRPGYGDLGVGHIHAGGSTPSLNRSYESSHRGEDDYQPNGAGIRPGPNTSV